MENIPFNASLIERLGDYGKTCPVSEFPAGMEGLDHPGLYAWWANEYAANFMSNRLEEVVRPGIVYIGQAGAIKLGSTSNSNLLSRLSSNHIGGTVRTSTFRLSVAAILWEEIRQYHHGDRKLVASGEQQISQWLAQNFRLVTAPFTDRNQLRLAEEGVLKHFNPALNLAGMAPSRIRSALKARRARLRRSADPTVVLHNRLKSTVSSRPILAPDQNSMRQSEITLHAEIIEIFIEIGTPWLSTDEIAEFVNSRARYIKRDGSPVTAFQIYRRTRKYSHIFKRDGSKVALIQT